MRPLFFVLGALLFTQALQAELRTIGSLSELPEQVSHDAHIFFQVDEVLMTATTSLGSSHWLNYRLKKRTDAGTSYEEAVLEEVPVYMEIQRKASMRLVEPNFVATLAALHALDLSLFAVSWRPPSLTDCTLNQLESLGIIFGDCDDFSVPARYPARIANHVLFAGVFNREVDVLMAYIKGLAHKPEQVVLVESNREKLDEMEEACKKAGLKFLGLHYQPTGLPRQPFNPEVAETQLKVFGTILNDQDAEKLIQMQVF